MPPKTSKVAQAAEAKPDRQLTPSWDVFLSHSSKDKGTATRLALDLQELGRRVWIDYENLTAGDLLPQEIGEAIRDSAAFVILWSATTDSSPWVPQELQAALVVGHRILLCRLDATPYEHHAELADRFWCDFSGSYETGLAGLMRGLAGLQANGNTRLEPPPVERAPTSTVGKMAIAQNAILHELDRQGFRKAAALYAKLDPSIWDSLERWPNDPDILSIAGYHLKNAVRIATHDGQQQQTEEHAGWLDKAERFFQRALAVEPGSMNALNGMGSLSIMRGDLEMAEHYCLRAIQQARHQMVDYAAAEQDLANIRLAKQRRAGQAQAAAARPLVVQAPLSADGSTVDLSYQGIAAAIPEEQRLALAESLRAFKAHLDSLGLQGAVEGELRVEISPDATHEAAFSAENGLITLKPVWASDKSVVFREYAHYALLQAAKTKSKRKSGAEVDAALESGLADYLPCSFVDDPVMGKIGAPVAFRAPCLRDLRNEETMDRYDVNARPQHKGQVWGGAFWQMRQMAGAQVIDRCVAVGWLAACAGKGDFESAFVTALLKESEKMALLSKVRKILRSRKIRTGAETEKTQSKSPSRSNPTRR